MVRLPEDLEFVLDPFQRLALPRREAVPVSVVKLRDMCLISRLFELITKTSSISGSGVDGTSSAGGGGATVAVDGIRLIVTSIFFGANFRPGTRCQRSDDAHAKAKPAPMTRTHPARGVQVVLKLPPAYCPRNC